jgi:hypothetical protein
VPLDAVNINFMAMEDSESAWCDAALLHASHIKSLKCLILNRSDVSDAGLSRVSALPDLECISASMTSVKGDCFKTFGQHKNLQFIGVGDDPLKEETIKYLSSCPKLWYVDMHHTGMGDLGVKYLSKCAHLCRVRLADNGKITDACIKDLLNLKHVSWLALEGTSVSAHGLKMLKPMNLDSLTIADGTCDKNDLAALHTWITRLAIVPRARKVDKSTEQLYAPLH